MRFPIRPGRLDELVTDAARDHPDRPAITDTDRTITYAELDRAVSGLAEHLVAAGVRPGDRVGVHLPKSISTITVIYAVSRTGAVAAPLDVSDPPERIARMAVNAGLSFLVTSTATDPEVAVIRREVGGPATGSIHIGPGLELVSLPCSPDTSADNGDSGGYLLFTSGSTGWPKGVLLSHSNVLHFVDWVVGELRVTPSDRIGSQSSLTFDLSTFEIFGGALAGACVCLLPDVSKAFPRDVVDWLRRNQISIFYAVPTLYQAMMRAGGIAETSLPDLRVIAFAGEPFPVGILQLYVEAFPHTDFYNLYGPTETNVCTFEKLSSTWSATDGLSIGRAIKELRVELVDDRHIVTREGEIAVLGPTVFLGYLEDGTLRDATSTIIFPFGYARRAYLTGDLGYYGDDGRIWLRGRRDHQVKRRGHRIELLDIESVAQEQPGVEACAAVWRPGSSNEGEIWLYIVHNGQTTDAITQSVRAALPRRMAPDQVHFVAELPLTARGKLDRDALAARTPIQERDHG